MAARRTRVTLSIPWDDEDHGYPANWGWDELLEIEPDENGLGVVLIDFEEVDAQGNIMPT